MTFSLRIGDADFRSSTDKDTINGKNFIFISGSPDDARFLKSLGDVDITRQVRELNDRVSDVRRQQDYQKEQETKFRDIAESVNSRAVWFIILQVIVLVLTTAWQMRHLTVFLKTKKVT